MRGARDGLPRANFFTFFGKNVVKYVAKEKMYNVDA